MSKLSLNQFEQLSKEFILVENKISQLGQLF